MSSVYGQSVTFTATVRRCAGDRHSDWLSDLHGRRYHPGYGGQTAGSATYTTTRLAIGSHTITAVYDGSSSDINSTSPNLIQTVNQDSTTTAVTASANPSVFGQSVTFTATVTAAAPGSGTPTGSVTLYMDGSFTPLGTGRSAAGFRILSIKTLPVGSHTITVFYRGDGNFISSTSAR